MIGDMGKRTVNNELNSMGVSGVYIHATDANGTVDFGQKELSKVQENNYVEAASPLMTRYTNVQVRSNKSKCVVWGIDSNAEDIISMQLKYGRLVNKTDIKDNAKVCIVDEAFAKANYKRSNIVGKKLNIYIEAQPFEFTVIGVVSTGGNILQGLMGDIVPTFLYVPYTTVTAYSQNIGITQIVAKLDETKDEAIATNSIIHDLIQVTEKATTIKVESINAQKDKLNGMLDMVTLILAAIGSISIIVAGLSIMTVMLVTVNERTREIGIKKSIGARKSTILLEFLVEALLLSLAGSIIGAGIGISIGALGAWILKIPLYINVKTILFCIGFCMLIGISFGVYPASKAAKLKPVDALRF
ncbi:FtsX-like permease family protein [Paludicola sp. MB14-C6]|uniref:ABC transporter permease n=1 Tax=Paludihabitans sp. MB14-C6 TaxID=3070656 RepID=UPI0027DD5FD9|nr:ABC transporter permease [Paludicola sp. MB14-C6]WMJ24473.1 FtsX-like permease family protein [Paludicola sp. MB14-C6]